MIMDDNGFGGEKQSFLWRRWYSWYDKHILTIFFNPLSGSVLRKQPTTCRTNMKKLPPSVVKHGWEILHWRNSLFDEFPRYGYGSIPISTIFSGMNIHKSQLFWCELQGYKVLTHCQYKPPSHVTGRWVSWGAVGSWCITTTTISFATRLTWLTWSPKTGDTLDILRPFHVSGESVGSFLPSFFWDSPFSDNIN